ncbi:putative lipid II flippase FtsW [Salinibacterium sp. NSLL150]|uniref:putative lipid II flippase FtsW n=1 Tax=unclassified Salinibacterium TaxID=2632331 RepID=UPI0018CF98E1|nr:MULTISPECIES: putative lipid II flippase FtsW [unclassified Salinibacterium]MBH0099254.1 putative lipid II flippase FtsW [Salinibacterium sp. NSLL35]MBH0102008.1 putative lipid II flippase FtsW [Salinibacterium sp. NSLL150]MBH0104768.1 putative lipid II flippase FtsW [Salinibacterium sp. NSLL16]MBH0107528.1 putative lipid II flippase FtsW [Salinibacterium sp. NSLL17]MBH0108692.1 putative lipid II flippase FtsW [Salinibacterium sp. NG22]
MTPPQRPHRPQRPSSGPTNGPKASQPDAASADASPKQQEPVAARVPVKRIFSGESSNFFLLLGTTLFLVIFGLVMVLSSSSVESYAADQGFFGSFLRQGLFALLGIPLMLIASRAPTRFWKRWAFPGLVLGAVLQLLVFVPGIGLEYGGNRNWIQIGSFSAQPSEFVKVAVIIWVAWVLSTKQDVLSEWRQVVLPVVPVAGAAIGFVLIGNDLGTASIMLLIVFACLFFAGVRLKFLSIGVLAVVVGALLFATTSSSRTSRIDIWLNGCTELDYQDSCWQIDHANWALAGGGLFGRGLGNSVAKRGWLPHADNDYIFAIIGEELGLIGAIVVLLLFVVLAVAFIRIIRTTNDSFVRIATAGVMVWTVGQAFVNFAVVLGVLPVLGVPLPLISTGGSALIATLLAIGIVLSFARSDHKAASAAPRPSGPASAPTAAPSAATPAAAPAQTAADRSRMLAANRARGRR